MYGSGGTSNEDGDDGGDDNSDVQWHDLLFFPQDE